MSSVLLRRVNEGRKKNAVIESTLRRKKRGGLDVFQFAETVEPEAWGDRSKDLQVRLPHHLSFVSGASYHVLLPPRTAFWHWNANRRRKRAPNPSMMILPNIIRAARTFQDSTLSFSKTPLRLPIRPHREQ